MPTLQEATNYDLSKFEPVQKMGGPQGAAPYQQYPAAPDRFTRSTVPLIGNTSPDGQRPFFNSQLPQRRVPIFNQLWSPFNYNAGPVAATTTAAAAINTRTTSS